MLSDHIVKRGEKFDEDHRTYLSNNTRGSKLGGITILILMVMAFWLVLGNEYVDYKTPVLVLLGIIFIIIFTMAILFLLKAKPFKKIGLDYVFLNAYRAYLSLENYEKPGKSEDRIPYFDAAKKEMNEIKWEIISGWENFESFNHVIPKLNSDLGLFITNTQKFSMALENKIMPTPVIRSTLEKLMVHFSQEDYAIEKINDDLKEYSEIQLPAETPERIKDLFKKKQILKHVVWISLFVGIGILSSVIMWALGGSRDVQLTVGGAFSSIPTGWYVIELLKNRLKNN